jgi:hypothetical protein
LKPSKNFAALRDGDLSARLRGLRRLFGLGWFQVPYGAAFMVEPSLVVVGCKGCPPSWQIDDQAIAFDQPLGSCSTA